MSPTGQATDVYVNSNPKVKKYITQATVLHEVLHNLTGLDDDALEIFVGLNPSKDCESGSICISNKLAAEGCVGKN